MFLLGISVFGLLLLNMVMSYRKYNPKPIVVQALTESTPAAPHDTTITVSAEEMLRADLEVQLKSALKELDSLKRTNSNMSRQIDVQKKKIVQLGQNIEKSIDGDDLELAKGELVKLRQQISSMMADNSRFVTEISALKQANQQLRQDYVVLDEANTQLQVAVSNTKMKLDTIENTKKQLETEKAVLSKRVTMASVIRTEKIEVLPVRVLDNGIEKDLKSGKRADALRICVNIAENKVTEQGSNTLYLRLVNSRGETTAIEQKGSGTFKDANNADVRYTMKHDFSYNNKPETVCMYWSELDKLPKDSYTAMLYNKGYMVGEQRFKWK